jgi:hypothetical protein
MATGIINVEGIFAPYTQPSRNPYIEETNPLYHDPSSPSSGGGGSSAPAAAPGSGAPGSSNIPSTTVARVPERVGLNGPRIDDPTGWGPRYRAGKLSDDSFGVERFTSLGVRQVMVWS